MRLRHKLAYMLAGMGLATGFAAPVAAATIDVTITIDWNGWFPHSSRTFSLQNSSRKNIYKFHYNENIVHLSPVFDESDPLESWDRWEYFRDIDITYNKNQNTVIFRETDIWCMGPNNSSVNDDCSGGYLNFHTGYSRYTGEGHIAVSPYWWSYDFTNYVSIRVHGYEDVPFNAIPLPLPGALLIGGLAALGVAAGRGGRRAG